MNVLIGSFVFLLVELFIKVFILLPCISAVRPSILIDIGKENFCHSTKFSHPQYSVVVLLESFKS